MSHPEYVLPNTPHAGYRYKMAMKHVEAAKAAGKSVEEIHEIFNSVIKMPSNRPKLLWLKENPIKKCMSCFKKC